MSGFGTYLSKCYLVGVAAYFKDVQIDDCPYQFGGLNYDAWMSGWFDAREAITMTEDVEFNDEDEEEEFDDEDFDDDDEEDFDEEEDEA